MQRGRRGVQTGEARAARLTARRQVEAKLAEAARGALSRSSRPAGPQFCPACSGGRHLQCCGLPCECLCYLGEEPDA